MTAEQLITYALLAPWVALGAWAVGFAAWTWPSFKYWRWRKWGRPEWCPQCNRIHRCWRTEPEAIEWRSRGKR